MSSNVLSAILCAAVFVHLPTVTGSDDKSKLKWQSEDGHIVEAILAPSSSTAAADSKSADKEKQVTFLLCHKGTKCTDIQESDTCDHIKSHLVPLKQLIVLIHGFTGSKNSAICSLVKDAYMTHHKTKNVIIVDWSPLAKAPWYGDATYGAITVGEVVARLLHHFVEDCKACAKVKRKLLFSPFLGFSLGAHAAGHAGRRYRELYGAKVGRITGLDPAGPGYTGYKPDDKLDPTDADYVHCIHTNDCSPWSACFGIQDRCGHADFYPNGGHGQPGCSALKNIGCSHVRAPHLYAESVKIQGTFRACCYKEPHKNTDAKNCDTGGKWNNMGHYSNAKGNTYCYLNTNAKPPYSISGESRVGNRGGKTKPILTVYWIVLPFILEYVGTTRRQTSNFWFPIG